MIYRAEIDGLRALAVIPVILFHAGFELFGGGFVGVDVFFVISGYLITTILIEDIINKRFNIINFYERRARRILPALTVVSFISVIFAWILLPDSYLKRMGDATMGVSAFVSNIVFWLQTNYFSEAAELQPLMHTWSLAVEEQYYILFPIFLILTWRFGKKSVFWIIILMTVISFLISEWGWRNNARANFYLAPTRAWELFAGSIAAFIVQNRGIKSNNLIASIGLIAVFYSFLFYNSSTPFPSVYTLVPVVGVVLIVLYADSKTIVAKLLGNKTLVGIGLISYSAYLWHQPLFAFTRHAANQIHIGYELRFLLIFATFAMAYLSWKYIEKPFRNKSLISQNSIFVISLVSLAGLFLLGLASKEAAKSGHYSLAKKLSENDFIYYQNMDDREFIEGRLIYPLKQVNNIVVGSSRVMQINSEMIGEPMFNFSVSGASIEDDIAISLEAVAKVGAKNVFLGMDPWLLNKHDGHTRYKSIIGLYEYWIERIKNKMPLQNYLSLNHNIDTPTNNFILTLRNKLYKSKDLIPKDRNVEAYSKKAYDGEHIYNEYDIINSKKKIVSPKTLDYAMRMFEYDLKSEENLILLINYLKNLNIKVTFILTPYHPDLYQIIMSDKPIFVDIENRFRKIAQQHNIEIIGSYDSSAVGCKQDEFYDGHHPTEACMRKLFNDF